MITISVIGRGTIGVSALLSCMALSKEEHLPIKLTISYDPTIPVTRVGETTTWKTLSLLKTLFGEKQTKEILKECGATYRKGTKFNWIKIKNRDFEIPYDGESVGVHFDSKKFCDTVLDYVQKDYPEVSFLHKKWQHGRIVDNSDLVIDCRGTPTKENVFYSNDYVIPNFKSVNSALIYQDEVENLNNEDYTGSIFHDMGWMFKIPLKHRTAYGFLYNNEINTKKEAREYFEKLKPETKDKELVEFSWNWYYRKRVLENKVMYMGNSLFFFEPAQAIPIHFYSTFLEKAIRRYCINYKQDYRLTESVINKMYLDLVDSAYCLLVWNYAGDLQIDSKFWNIKKEEANTVLKYSEQYKKQLLKYQKGETTFLELFTHDSDLMREYAEGFRIQVKK